MSSRPRIKIELNQSGAAQVHGPRGEHLKIIARATGAEVTARGTQVSAVAEDESSLALVQRILEELEDIVRGGGDLDPAAVARTVDILRANPSTRVGELYRDAVYVSSRGKVIAPKTPGQQRYVRAISRNDIVFGVGPAGTGKTYLAMACAVAALSKEQVHRILLCRPALEAGERLGFLPGDLEAKVNPYLRPLYDALHDLMPFESVEHMIEGGRVEVAPLAFMRGRTLNDSFVILDEAQNTTREQMKMFLTRLGFGSKAVITGDITQIDLPAGRGSGMVHALRLLQRIDGIETCRFTELDVVRHPLIQKIIRAYEEGEGGNGSRDRSGSRDAQEESDG